MTSLRSRSFKGLLLFHEFAFLVLVLVTGSLGALWSYFWQQSSGEALRLNALMHQADQIRGDMYRQLKEVTRARLTEDPSALGEYSSYSERVNERFGELVRSAVDDDERLAIDLMQQSYLVVRNDMDKVFTDPNEQDPSTAVLSLLAGPEPLLRFRSSFDEFLLVGKGSIESVLIEGVEPTTSARCFVATLSGHRFVGGIPGQLQEERLSDAVQMPWIRVYTERGTLQVRSERVLWIKT